MVKFKLSLILFLILSIKGSLLANNYENRILKDSLNAHYLILSPQLSYYQHLDFQNSPILYKGTLAGIGLSFESDGNHYKYDISLGTAYGSIKGETQNASYLATQINSQLQLKYVRRFNGLKRKIKTFAGASLLGHLNFHNNPNLQNASLSLTGLTNVALSTEFERTLTWKAKHLKIWFLKFKRRNRNLKLNFSLDVPIYFLNFRPGYSNISDFTDGENLWDLKSKHYWIFKNAFQINSKTSLSYFLSNNNAFRISYLWQAYRFKDTFDNYQAAHHIIEVSLLFRFN